MAYIIGITGGIATGKTTVSNYLKEKGFLVIDSDQLSYDALTIDDVCINQVFKYFPEVKNNNQIDRNKLGEIIFNDKERKEKLNQIVHPYVITRLKQVREAYKDKETIIFFDIPLLYEVNLESLCDEVWVVYIPSYLQLERLIKRNQLTNKQANARIKSQLSIEVKKDKADKVLDNQKDLKQLYQQIDKLLKEYDYGTNG